MICSSVIALMPFDTHATPDLGSGEELLPTSVGAAVFAGIAVGLATFLSAKSIWSVLSANVGKFLGQKVLGAPLWMNWSVMVFLTAVGYWLDNIDGQEVGASVFFINTKVRMSSPLLFDAQVRYWFKAALLIFAWYIELCVLYQPSAGSSPTISTNQTLRQLDARESLCLLLGSVYTMRVLTQMTWLSRGISWVEVFSEAGLVIPVSLASLAYGAVSQRGISIGALEVLAVPVFFGGTWLNLWSEYSRHVWKSDPSHLGHLYTEDLFAFARHINYSGEVLSFLGFALASNIWNLWVPIAQGLGLALFSIPELEAYLSKKYAAEWVTYSQDVPWQAVPFVW